MNSWQLLDRLDESIYLIDPDSYLLIYLNLSARNRLGILENQYKGKPCYDVLYGYEQPCPQCRARFLTENKFETFEIYSLRTLKDHFVKSKLIRSPTNELLCLGIETEIVNLKRFAQTDLQKLDIIESIGTCLSHICSNCDCKINIQSILYEIGRYYQASRTFVFEFDYESATAKKTYEWCAVGISPLTEQSSNVTLSDLRPWIFQLKSEGSVRIENLDDAEKKHPGLCKIFRSHGATSLLSVPLYIDGQVAGAVGVENLSLTMPISCLELFSQIIVPCIRSRCLLEKLDRTYWYDPLTGLRNHSSYTSFLESFRLNPLASLGVVTIDLNGLKLMNEQYGHDSGDFNIVQIARLLEKAFERDHLFRLGGDEFTILCENTSFEDFNNRVSHFKHLLESKRDFTASIGYTWSNEPDLNPLKMFNYADHLMSIDKQNYYYRISNLQKTPQTSMLYSLLKAVEENRLIPYLQAKIDVKDCKLVGAEALVRRIDPERGIIPPNEFVSQLEQEGIIKHVDFCILEQVLQLLHRWISKGYTPIPISVNFSRITLMEPSFINELMKIQSKYRVPPSLIEIEVTERIGLIEKNALLALSHALHSLNFIFSLDDFGIEYTNISLLATIDIDVLKLDKSLIDHIVLGSKNSVLVKSIIDVSHDFNIKCVAEGVETQEQMDILKLLDCDYVQGYLFSRPIPIKEFECKYIDELNLFQ